jgi:hypothetical protein
VPWLVVAKPDGKELPASVDPVLLEVDGELSGLAVVGVLGLDRALGASHVVAPEVAARELDSELSP